MTSKPSLTMEQKIRQEAGQLRHSLQKLIDTKKQMHVDLVAQRDDISRAIACLDAGNLREARAILEGTLRHRERTREPRKVRN